MSLPKLLSIDLILALAAFLVAESANVYYRYRMSRCIYSSSNMSDMRSGTMAPLCRKKELLWTGSAKVMLKKLTPISVINQDVALLDSVKPKVKLSSVTQAGGKHPAVLMCSAYEFYPPHIKVSWLRDGKLMTSEATSTMELADGDWYYQIHSELEYTPKSGEKISCMVEHASVNKPMIYDWDPSLPESERNKIVIGASGLVLGIIIAAAGLIYYKKKSTGRILVPH
ncbi:rano class II histocompatibility antigen, A beta chain-like isoform X2 [Megalobrama amblycephala]|uniref:rano class II histocompatibility antigen, A beta chain-like isoform X2 n=1 Tax=Megalobrama amblycephala TaxID=75352 RepID=UPI002013DDBC|nr:rano class II histocompatibility antigen, A beta chain-like isoform X2 [Megalobrama amblycephala]